MWFKRASDKPPLTPTQKTIKRTRHVLTGGRWFLISGLVFYSLMTTTPFVSKHSEWQWSGFVLGLIVDAAFIMALSAESTLARHGVTQLGAWPTAFRWLTGLSSVFLNIWLSIERRDWVGVAVHLIAPALVMLLAEVGPVYMAALADAESKAERAARTAWKTETFAERYGMSSPMVLPMTGAEPIAARFMTPEVPSTGTVPPAEPEPEQQQPEPTAHPVSELAQPRLSNAEADDIIEQGWRHRLKVDEVAAAAGRHPSTVRRKYKELDAALTV
ncbi:hypothetical protein ACFYOA_08030 [Streptomyces iakyrus]|uniref:hypothetical protein n=1 Tax=Streptomyces iakyrus TaxID=68219 RepID=UPI00368EEBD9